MKLHERLARLMVKRYLPDQMLCPAMEEKDTSGYNHMLLEVLVEKYLPGFHLHENPKGKRKGKEGVDAQVSESPGI